MNTASRYDWHPHADATHWAAASADAIATALRTRLQTQERMRLLLSGGSTPAPVYDALSLAELDWSRVHVGLVDERWLPPTDPDSNTHLVARHLLQNRAADALFESITGPGIELDDAVDIANRHAARPADVVVLGMGPDGHTASLFPDMAGLEQALASPRAYVAVDADGCPGAGAWRQRISLTPAGLAPAAHRLLLIRGEAKRALFEEAASGIDVSALPIRIALQTPGAILQVHWSA